MVKTLRSICSLLIVSALLAVGTVAAVHFSASPAIAAAAVDPFGSYVGSPTGTATDAQAVTTSDTVDLTYVSKWIGCGVAGNLNVITKKGTTVIITCVAGVPIPLAVTRIKATSTTATGIWVLTN